MESFEEFNISKQLFEAITDLGFEKPTPIQSESFPIVMSGKNVVGIAQTGTGKTLAYMLPILQQLKYSDQHKPRVIVLVPTRELVVQVVEQIELFTKYKTVRTLGVFGGVNINTQKNQLAQGCDIVVGTPGRLYDLAINRDLQLQDVRKLVIDEVDVMLDLGFQFQLNNIFELLSDKRQNIMFSATMTDEVDSLIDNYFVDSQKIVVAVSGTPLENINQTSYSVPNFFTKVNLLSNLLQDKDEFNKVLLFIDSKRNADLLYTSLEAHFWGQLGVIHSNKSQNNRLGTIEAFNGNISRILIATDVIARGLDLDEISHVINFDVPKFPENYMHRIGRTGRADKSGNSILLFTEKEEPLKKEIEKLMGMYIPQSSMPAAVKISNELSPDEKPKIVEVALTKKIKRTGGSGFHEKKAKNMKTTNLGAGQKIKLKKAKKYKKPITRGAKNRKKKR